VTSTVSAADHSEDGGTLPSSLHLAELARVAGVDEATEALARACEGPAHALRGEPRGALAHARTSDVEVLVVPAFLHERFPQLGGRGEVVLEVSASRGVTARVVETSSRATLDENARAIARAIEESVARHVCLVSMSKGGAETRRTFEAMRGVSLIGRVAAWLNVCGLVRGCALVDEAERTLTARALSRATLQVLGADTAILHELRTDAPSLAAPISIPPSVRVVNVVALPQTRSLHGLVAGRHRRLAARGPNDAMSTVRDMLVTPGEIIVLRGQHHVIAHDVARAAVERALDAILPRANERTADAC